MTNETTVQSANRLAGLLSDLRGAEVLAEMRKLAMARDHVDGATDGDGPTTGDRIGTWQVERVDDGIAMRMVEDAPDRWLWAGVPYVAPAGARTRVAVVGESAARGWLLDPAFNPTGVLTRQLDLVAPDGYQCVDLARVAADLDDLGRVARALPLIAPDMVVFFAGNNFSFPPLEQDGFRDQLAAALCRGSYADVRRVFIDEIMLPRVADVLSQLAALNREHGVKIVMVVPQSDLCAWVPAPAIEVPTLPGTDLTTWYGLRAKAMAALEEGRWDDVLSATEAMATLDGGVSPVTGHLRGRAAGAAGDAATASQAYVASRDALSGILVENIPSVHATVRRALLDFAAEHGFDCVDLGEVLASPAHPELPDSRMFLDNCHLSDIGIEHAMAAVADVVLGLDRGTTKPGAGAPAPTKAIAHALAAAYCANMNQPAELVRTHLDRAVEADADTANGFLRVLLDTLDSPGPRWMHQAIGQLMAQPQAMAMCFQLLQTRQHSVGFWTFRQCVHELMGPNGSGPDGRWLERDLLATGDGRALRTPSYVAGKAYLDATTETTRLAFDLDEPAGGQLHLTYRVPDEAGHVAVSVNRYRVASLAAGEQWRTESVSVPADATWSGVNWVAVTWPVPAADLTSRLESDVSALARGTNPDVLPSFGGLFEARWIQQGSDDVPTAGPMSRTNASSRWLHFTDRR